jgi:Fe-S cluster assembly protein SufD
MTKQNQTITVNRLPAKTWNWLKMNETVIGMPRIDGSIAIKQSVAEAGQAEAEKGEGEDFHNRWPPLWHKRPQV